MFHVGGRMDRQRHLTQLIVAFHRSQWPHSLRHDSAATRLLACGFESCHRHGCLPLVSILCRQVEVSVLGSSFVQRSPTACGVSL